MKKNKKNGVVKAAALLLAAMLVSTSALYSCEKAPSETTGNEGTEIGENVTPDSGETDELPPEEEPEQEISEISAYIDAENGSDENDGLSPETAVSTIEKAFEVLNNAEEQDKTLVISGSVTAPSTGDFPGNSKMITITGSGEGAQLNCGSNGINLGGPITIENINLHIVTNSKFISTNGNELVIGEGVTATAKEGVSDALNFHIGTYGSDGPKENVTFRSDVTTVHVGAYYNNQTQTTEGAVITVDGANISAMSFGSDGWLGTQKGVVFTDTVSVVLNKGSIENFSFQKNNRAPSFECAVQLIANGGLSFPELPDFSPVHGLYELYCEEVDGCYILPGDKAGNFIVVGGKTAVAVNEDGKKYISANGALGVPAGKYTVTFDDEVLYTNDGEKIEIKKDFELDLSTVLHSELEGKLFVGWAYENGEVAESTEFKAGDVLVAEYVDFDPENDLKAVEAYITADGSDSLTFVMEKSSAVSNLNVTSYGILIIPADALGTQPLKKGSTYGETVPQDITDVTETAADSKDGVRFAAEIDGINDETYRTVYSARGYICYEDIHGAENVLYTDVISANFYNLALEKIESDDISDDEKAYLVTITDQIKSKIREEYLAQNKIDVVGTSADKKTWIYKLEESGVMVREVDIDSGKGGDPVEIIQVTDLHFNYCNERDFEEANPSIMATYKGRKWLANGSSVPNAVRSLEYASFADQIVVTGDILDYMSWGCFELTKKHVFDPYPTVMATMGNHEATRRCQDTPATPDPTTLESRLEILQENWIHDIYYYSKVIDEKVMLIQMDNGTASKFWDSQVEPFKADLALAREKGYTVLVFYHIPLRTNNPAETDVYPIRRNDTNNYNFYEKGIGGPSAEGATKEVYDLITNNADIIKGTFCGHFHSDYYTEIVAKTASGEDTVIPQYILTGTPYDQGHALKITVK